MWPRGDPRPSCRQVVERPLGGWGASGSSGKTPQREGQGSRPEGLASRGQLAGGSGTPGWAASLLALAASAACPTVTLWGCVPEQASVRAAPWPVRGGQASVKGGGSAPQTLGLGEHLSPTGRAARGCPPLGG